MIDLFIKLFGGIIDFFWPNKIKELQIKVKRLNINNAREIQDFIEVYDAAFPYDGTNYTSGEMLEMLEDIHNKKKHVSADNILLVAKYKDDVIGFIACFYYPQKKYGIIGYIANSNSNKELSKYVSPRLLKKLKNILLGEYKCKLLVFELEPQKREKSKIILFKTLAKKLGLVAYELDFDYYRPKLNLEDTKDEAKLSLLVIPISYTSMKSFTKEEILDILSFIHFYCYGDYYNKADNLHKQFQSYMESRMNVYKANLAENIKAI